MPKSSLLLCLVAVVLSTACSKSTDAIIPTDMSTWDKELAPVVQKLNDEDKKNLVGYVARMKMAEAFSAGKTTIPFGMTVGQAIDEQKKWAEEFQKRQAQEKVDQEKRAAEAAVLKQRIEGERAEMAKRINEAVTVTLLSKKELPRNFDLGRYSQYQEVAIGVQNKSQKSLKGLSGKMEFIDVFDKVVATVHFEVSETIKASQMFRWVGGRDFNQFNDEHKALWNLEEGKYKSRFVPETLIFDDGEKLTMPGT